MYSHNWPPIRTAVFRWRHAGRDSPNGASASSGGTKNNLDSRAAPPKGSIQVLAGLGKLSEDLADSRHAHMLHFTSWVLPVIAPLISSRSRRCCPVAGKDNPSPAISPPRQARCRMRSLSKTPIGAFTFVVNIQQRGSKWITALRIPDQRC